MATTNPCSSHLLSASTHFHGFPKMSLKIHSPFLHKLKDSSQYLEAHRCMSSLSEMSYCAHEKKLTIIPVPLLIGFVLMGVLKETALELSPLLKVAF
ncbi:hypothetical protein QQP08_006032 [Theobroma cacao]|nr:hypothetical protein QQP08_006032 [Theobroma cacao]